MAAQHRFHVPLTMRHIIVAPLCASLLAACSDSSSPEQQVATLTSITISPAFASVAVGENHTITVQGRDQNGTAIIGLSFSWISTNASVATVTNGVATGVAVGSATITAASGGITSNTFTLTVTGIAGIADSLTISKSAVLLSTVGQSDQVTARITNAQGAPIQGAVTWTSSAPGKVSVSSTGTVQAMAIGSAMIFAEAGGARSLPTLVIVATPQAGSLLVTDAQVVSVGPQVSVGEATQYEVTLQGVTAPSPGTVVLSSGQAAVAGKVVTTRQQGAAVVVTLVIVPLYQLFTSYDISLAISLSTFPVEGVPNRSGRVVSAAAVQPFRAFDCDGSIKPQLTGEAIQLSFENNLQLILEDRPGYSKHALEGSMALVGNAALKLKAGFNATGKCEAQAKINLPVFGWFSVIVMPAVRVGLGARLDGEILLVQGELGVEGKVGFSGSMGWQCGGMTAACTALDNVSPLVELKTKSKIPSEKDMQAKVSGQFYVLAGLDASIGLGVLSSGILEARFGPEQSFDLAFEDDQAARNDYAAQYDLKLEGVIEPGAGLKKAIEKVIADDGVAVKFKAEVSSKVSESPKGSLTISTARARPNAPVDFTVDFAPASSVAYFLLGYNVTGVHLYRKREDETRFTPWRAMNLIATTRATYRWVPVEADAGKYEFAAFVNTQVLTPLLEVKPSSIQPLEVSCFSAASASRLASPKRSSTLAANVSGVIPAAATVCADVWSGKSTYIGKTPGLPGVNITSNANITWTYDPVTSGNGFTHYDASGTFDLAINTIDGCIFVLAPNTFTIVKSQLTPSRLTLFNLPFTPPTYGFGGSQLVNFTSTAKCPGKPDVVSQFNGFLATFAYGTGPFTPGQATLSGMTDDAATFSSWSFSRP